MSAHERIGQAVHGLVRQMVDQHRQSYTGIVVDDDPWAVSIVGRSLVVDEESGLVLSAWVRQWDQKYALEVDDSVLVVHHDGTWIVTDVLSDKTVTSW
jgi:hypothetical protein